MKNIFLILSVAFYILAFVSCTPVSSASLEMLDESVKWSEWKRLHKKSYVDAYEENFRRAIWSYNLKKIAEHNMVGRTFTVGLNKLSDLTPTENRQNLMLKQPAHVCRQENIRHDNTLPRVRTEGTALPEHVDWRKRGCVTPVLNQGEGLGSWAVSDVGSLEGQHCIVTKQLVSLDAKKLSQCCTSCNSVADGFCYMIAHNHEENTLVLSSKVRKENCNFSTAAYGASLTGFVELPSGNELALQQAVALVGPVSVTIDAGSASFQIYTGGVYDEPSCSSTQLDHAVLVVGYGTLNGKDYWLVKNSWGVNWGMRGYIMMSRNKDNQCGIATAAIYPTGVTVK